MKFHPIIFICVAFGGEVVCTIIDVDKMLRRGDLLYSVDAGWYGARVLGVLSG